MAEALIESGYIFTASLIFLVVAFVISMFRCCGSMSAG